MNHTNLFLTVLEVKKSRLEVQADRLSAKDPLGHRWHFLVRSSHGRGMSKLLSGLLGMTLDLFVRVPVVCIQYCSLKVQPPNTLIIRFHYLSLGRNKHQTTAVTIMYLLWVPSPLGTWEGGKVKVFCLKQSRFGALEILTLSRQTSKQTKKHQKIKIPNPKESKCLL